MSRRALFLIALAVALAAAAVWVRTRDRRQTDDEVGQRATQQAR